MLQANNLVGFGAGAAAAAAEYVGIATSNETSSVLFEVSLAVPTHSVGDLLICIVHADDNDPVAPAGWTIIRVVSDKPALAYWYRIATAGEPATYTWTISKEAKVVLAGMIAFSNASYDVQGVTSSTGAFVTSINAPDITATATGILIAACSAKNTITPPSGFTEVANLSNGIMFSVAYKLIPSGSTGTSTFTFASSKCEAAHISII